MTESPESTESQDSSGSELALDVARRATFKEVDDISFKHLAINSILALLSMLVVLYIFFKDEQTNWWSLCLLFACITVVALDDILRWIKWQVVIERALQHEPSTGFWVEVSESERQVKAEIGSDIYPERSLWQVEILPRTVHSELSLIRSAACVHMHPDAQIPVAVKTESDILLLKPAVKGMSLSLLDFFSGFINKLFPKKPYK